MSITRTAVRLKVTLDRVEPEVMRRLANVYLYDFGDDWQHVIKLERWFENTDTVGMPFLLEASGRCPPEDIGGPEGYAAFLAALADAAHPGHAEALETAPAGFDPTTVDRTKLERQVDALAQQWLPRSARK